MTSLAETRQLLGAWLTAVADVVRGVNAAEPPPTTSPASTASRPTPSSRRWALTQGFRALLAVPLAAPRGVLVAYSREPREFGAAEIELVELLAQHATFALETAELRAAQERTIAELSTQREMLEWADDQHGRLMQVLLNEAGLQRLVDGLVLPLEEHDARKKSQLCETVRAWLAVGASVPAAAKELIVHPNTVAYRLTRAEQLLHRDLRSTATRMELQLAFTARDVQRARGRV